jgi:integrase
MYSGGFNPASTIAVHHLRSFSCVAPPLIWKIQSSSSFTVTESFSLIKVSANDTSCAALRWGNVDTKAQVLRVCETVYEGHFDRPKTKRSLRTIPIGAETAALLASLLPAQVNPHALVFSSAEGVPLDRRNLLRKHVKPAAKKMGLHVTWHLLRHSYATMLDGMGTPVGTMQSLLGHATPKITREIYLHAIPQEQRRAVESIERLVLALN